MKRSQIKRRPPRRSSAEDLPRKLWLEGMSHECAMRKESTCCGRIEGHHAIPKQALRKHGHTEFMWDRRNRVPLCEMHHRRHTLRHEPMPRSLLPGGAVELAFEIGLLWLLERSYPAAPPARGGS